MAKRFGKYVPKRGDIVWLDFNPKSGHEQKGIRPAITISPHSYNQKTGLALFCPITSQKKGYPFEVDVKGCPKIAGIVIVDQIKSLDWQIRNAVYICKANKITIDKITNLIELLIS